MKKSIWLALIAVYISWGSTYLAIRFGVETIPPFLLAATRFLVAGSILYAWRRLAGDPLPTRRQWRSAAIVGFFLLLGGNGAVTWAEQHVVSSVAALLVGTAPLWMALIDAFRPGGERPRPLTAAGLLLGFVGIFILVGPAQLTSWDNNLNPLGVAALISAALLWSIGSLYSRKADLPTSPLLGTGMEMLTGGGALLVAGSLSGDWQRLQISQVSLRSLGGLAYLIVFGSLIGFAAYTWLLRSAPTPLVSTYAYVNPLIAILVGYLFAQEPVTPRIIAAAAGIIGSVILINLGRTTRRPGTGIRAAEATCGDD